jgi:hypothetical protein
MIKTEQQRWLNGMEFSALPHGSMASSAQMVCAGGFWRSHKLDRILFQWRNLSIIVRIQV